MKEFAFKCVLATCICMVNVSVMSGRGMCVIICSLHSTEDVFVDADWASVSGRCNISLLGYIQLAIFES